MTTPPNPLKTPASEAMEDLPDDVSLMEAHENTKQQIFDWFMQHEEKVRTALTLLDLVQSGQAKVLKREPEILFPTKNIAVRIDCNECCKSTYRILYNAAEPMPQDEGDKP